MLNINQFMQQAQAVEKKMREMREALAAKEFEGRAGGGLVSVTINGEREPKSVKIDPSILKPEEKETLEDLIVAAFNDSLKKAERESKDFMGKIFGDAKLPPGFKPPF